MTSTALQYKISVEFYQVFVWEPRRGVRCKRGMNRLRALLPTTLAMTLLLPAGAEAKEMMGLQVCAADGCTAVRDGELLGPGVLEGPPVSPPTRAEPFVRLRLAVGDGTAVMERFSTTYLPRAGLMRGAGGTWVQVDASGVAALREATRARALFPAARLDLPAAPRPPAPAPAAAPDESGGGLPAWLLVAGVALLATAALVPVLLARREPAG